MALNINTNITNNLDGYLLDAKNVKGTYVVVANYSELANLPSACVVNGTLAYVSNDQTDPAENNGFWQYNGSNWVKKELEAKVVSINVSDNAPDPTQTYTFTISSDDFLTLYQGARLQLNFYQTHEAVILFYPDLFREGIATFQSNILCVINNNKYLATMSVDGSQQSNNATLSFSEIEGGGGSGATQKVYAFSLKTSTDGNAISTNNYVEMVAKISEDTFNNEFLPNFNTVGQQLAQMQSTTWININNVNEFVTFENTYHSVCGTICMALLVEYCLKNNTIAYAVLEDFSAGDGMLLLHATTITYATGLGTTVPYNVLGLNVDGTNSTKNWFDSANGASTYHLDFSANAISSLTYTEETETTGGSSSSQLTIPERFSLAYNLVVNINQEQFANGSWTGDNTSNIRTFQYNGSNADQAKATELVEFLTGVPVLDEYNATKPTPCFVFCTQSNICWKLQWESNGLKAYQVNNFPFVVKKKYYNFVLQDSDGANSLSLQINIPYETMQDVYDSINQVLGGNISTPQEVIAVYDSLKADNIQSQQYGMLIQLFGGLAQYCLYYNLSNIIGNMDGAYKVTGASAFTGILYNGNNELFSITSATGKISFTSNSTLVINEYDSDRLD